ncbi:FecR family protein [Pedobacter sp. ok626]|uniref:FecR family protein n=1 Tax=Pedobacter sp. ok626 TaxID=1761882 RepID=UPI00087DFA1F|nr:FecR family protein [Pedobacter sp. ok626]SDK64420.1 FecR family protein [Pedobacter sp. ok626]
MTPEEFIKLSEKYIAGCCSPEEEKLLLSNKDAFKIRDDDGCATYNESLKEEEIRGRVFQQIEQTIAEKKIYKPLFAGQWWAVAAILLISVSVGILFFNRYTEPSNVTSMAHMQRPIKPGTDKAVLILADGSKIQLDEAKNGVLSDEGKTLIKKTTDGMLVYEAGTSAKSASSSSLNTITIPRGGKYRVKLPDGTWVWLNSESTLTYPEAFSGATRLVELKGEAYFEVARNKEMPFIVKTSSINVEVLGTHFNVSAYAGNAATKTTLLEGAVKLRDGQDRAVMLKPGEQGTAVSKGISVAKVKVQEVVAWKDGYFVFRENTIQEIMEQVERWYDVDIEYRGKINEHVFGGVYSKNKELSELLKGLELTGLVHFKIEGRRIIVMS